MSETMILVRGRWEIATTEINSETGKPQWIRRDTSYICDVGAEKQRMEMPQVAEPPMRAAEALEIALEALRAEASQTDTASPEGHRVRLAIDTITALTVQQGCEHFDAGATDGMLTTLCDIIVFG